mgnify:CR=1 FL=1
MRHLVGAVLRVLRRYAKRLPEQRWRLHALACTLGCAAAGLIVQLADLQRGYWLTLALIATLQLENRGSLARALQASMISLGVALALIYLGHSLQSPPAMVATILPLIVLSRALQAHHYGLFVVQVGISFVLLADVRSVGVQGDGRTYGHPIVLRPVSSEDAMTADWSRIPYDVLATISTRITNECRQINRVVLDCTSKPPATIEWE